MHHLDLPVLIAHHHGHMTDTTLSSVASLEEEQVAWLWILDLVCVDSDSTRGTGDLDPL
jgi:hypothetical protein